MPSVLLIASFIGSVAFAFSGFLVGVRRQLDWMGVFIVAFLTANGGGIIRDVLTGKTPAVLQSDAQLYLVGGVMAASILLRLHRHTDVERKAWFVASDSVGLVAFAVAGSLAGLDAGLSLFGVVALSLITAVGGGLLRDILVNQTPAILHEGFYGSVAILLGITIYLLEAMDLLNPLTVLLACGAAFLLRIIAHARDWHLPKVG